MSYFVRAASFMVWLPTISNQFIQTLQTGEGSDQTLCGIIASTLDAAPNVSIILNLYEYVVTKTNFKKIQQTFF